MFLLDTDVLSNLRKTRPHPRADAWIERTGWSQIETTVITVAEIQCGIQRQIAANPAYADATQAWLDRILAVGEPRVHVLTARAAMLMARMHETPALRTFVVADPRQKFPKTSADLAIAAIAITEGAIVATGNRAHFALINDFFPLPGIYNPFEDVWVREPDARTDGAGP